MKKKEIFYAIAEHVKKRIRGMKRIRTQESQHVKKRIRETKRIRTQEPVGTLFRDADALYALRRVPEALLSAQQRKILLADSFVRAQEAVPDPNKRAKICEAAKMRRKKNRGRPLSKPQLKSLDQHFLARGGQREPDPEAVRWVLRAARLHPQAAYQR